MTFDHSIYSFNLPKLTATHKHSGNLSPISIDTIHRTWQVANNLTIIFSSNSSITSFPLPKKNPIEIQPQNSLWGRNPWYLNCRTWRHLCLSKQASQDKYRSCTKTPENSSSWHAQLDTVRTIEFTMKEVSELLLRKTLLFRSSQIFQTELKTCKNLHLNFYCWNNSETDLVALPWHSQVPIYSRHLPKFSMQSYIGLANDP